MSSNNAKALAITILLAAVYFACQTVTVPYAASYHLLTLGLKPAFGAFMFVELLSFVVPPLTSFRRQGLAGRRKLNVAALLLAIVIALLQGYYGAQFLLADPDTELPGDVLSPTAAEKQFLAIVMVSLLGGAILATALAHGITRWGIANGFSVLMLGEFLWLQVTDAIGSMSPRAQKVPAAEFDLTKLILLGGTLAAGVWLLSRRHVVPARTREGLPFEFSIPPLPAGSVPLGITYFGSLLMAFAIGGTWLIGPWTYFLLLLFVGVTLWSWVLYHWFSSPGRILSVLAGRLKLSEQADLQLTRRAIAGTAALVVTVLVLATMDAFSRDPGDPWALIDWITIAASLLAVAGGMLDVSSLWLFRERSGSSVRLLELDNVHLASYAHALLKDEGIDCSLQGYQHRRLLFHFGAAIKIGVYVPASQAESARQALRIEEFTTI